MNSPVTFRCFIFIEWSKSFINNNFYCNYLGLQLKVKTALSEKINQPVEKLCLIFSGKILKDHETLDYHCELRVLCAFIQAVLWTKLFLCVCLYVPNWLIFAQHAQAFPLWKSLPARVLALPSPSQEPFGLSKWLAGCRDYRLRVIKNVLWVFIAKK